MACDGEETVRSRQRIGKNSQRRLLFASYHCYIDPSSGAAVSARELLAGLSARGWEVRTFCGPLVDFDRGEDARQLLSDQQLTYREVAHSAKGHPFSLLSFLDGDINSGVFVPHCAKERRPSQENGSVFYEGFKQAVRQWRPDVLLTYGGYWLAGAVMEHARRCGIPVVFWLRNFAYRDARLFELVDLTIVPSCFAADHYRTTLGLDSVAIPSPLSWDRVLCDPSSERYVTFVNPQPGKGVFLFARIAEQLHRLRPDIPLLVVEGRSGIEWLERTELDLSGLTNLSVMENTPDARDFYRVSHVALMPSLAPESFGRIAAEAMINGIPVIASNRGALPEVVGEAGFVIDVPERYTGATRAVPSADEVRPWVETIVRLWDDPDLHARVSRQCRERAQAWRPELLLSRYDQLFKSCAATCALGARMPSCRNGLRP